MWYGHDFNLSTYPLLRFGSVVMAHVPVSQQVALGSRSFQTYAVGVAPGVKGGVRWYNPATKRIIIRRSFKVIGPDPTIQNQFQFLAEPLESTSSLLDDFLQTLSDEPDIPSDLESTGPSLLSDPSVSEDMLSRATPDSLAIHTTTTPASLNTISSETAAPLGIQPRVPASSLDTPPRFRLYPKWFLMCLLVEYNSNGILLVQFILFPIVLVNFLVMRLLLACVNLHARSLEDAHVRMFSPPLLLPLLLIHTRSIILLFILPSMSNVICILFPNLSSKLARVLNAHSGSAHLSKRWVLCVRPVPLSVPLSDIGKYEILHTKLIFGKRYNPDSSFEEI